MKVMPMRAATPTGNRGSIAIIGLLFFVFGFVTWLNGSLIPVLRIICQLSTSQALLVTFVFYAAYTVMALPAAAILRRIGYRTGMALGMAIMALGALLHIPAAYLAAFPFFLLALFVIGSGLTILQTASNPYIVLLGPAESAARRISIMGIINKSAGVLAPLAFAALIPNVGNGDPAPQGRINAAMAHSLANGLVRPYLGMAALLLLLAALLRAAPLPEIDVDGTKEEVEPSSIWRFPHLVLGAITLFFYMGLEVMAGDTIGLFGQSLGMVDFVSLTSYTMGFMVLGYAIGALVVPRLLSQRKALALSGFAGLASIAGISMTLPESHALSEIVLGWTGLSAIPDPVFCVALMGLSNALVWPTVWPLALDGLGKLSSTGSALLVMAISGGAVIPQIFGWIAADMHDMQAAYLLGAPCYGIVLLYAIFGSRMRSWSVDLESLPPVFAKLQK